MQCQSCGIALQPGAVACPSCGAPTSSAPSDFSLYESSDNTVPYIGYRPSIETSSVSSSQQSPANPQPYTPPPMYTSQQFYTGTPPFPGAMQQPPPGQQRGGLSAGMIALFIMLALLLVLGSGLIYYAIAIRPAQHQTQHIPTTAQHTTPIATTSPQDLYTRTTSGTPALNDPLSPQNPHGWQAIDGNSHCTFTGHALHVDASPAGSTRTTSGCVAPSTSFGNCAYQVLVTITQGNLGGLAFRADTQGTGLYLFAIESEGVYELVAADSKGHVKLLTGASSSAINTGLNQTNLLTVIARGSMIYLYVNKQYLTSISDSTSSAGAIGVVGENTVGGPVDVAFSQIQVWKL